MAKEFRESFKLWLVFEFLPQICLVELLSEIVLVERVQLVGNSFVWVYRCYPINSPLFKEANTAVMR